MKRSRIIVLIVALFCSSEPDGLAQGAVNDVPIRSQIENGIADTSTRLEREIPQLMKEGDVPGLAAAFISDGKVTWHRNFGFMNVTSKQAVRDDTVFEAASLGKPVFAYAVLKLVDAGMLDLDKPLNQYLDEPYIEMGDWSTLITARRVLTHTTGFPNWRPHGKPLKIQIKPGERFSYSGEGFVFLQKVVERVSGLSVDRFIKKMVFDPLGMEHSSYSWQPAYEEEKATGHDGGGNPMERRKPSEANVASSLHTTSLDYAKFVIGLMNGTGLKYETTRAMLTPQIEVEEECRICVFVPAKGMLSPFVSWGLGIGLQQVNGDLSFWHWGDNDDFHCFMLGYPRQKLGLVIFTNSGYGHAIIPKITATAIGREQPAYSWLGYEPINSPIKRLYHDIQLRGVSAILEYREQRKIKTAVRLNREQMDLLADWLKRNGRVKESIEILKLDSEEFPDSSNLFGDPAGSSIEI